MKYVVTAENMRFADQYTSETIGLPSIVLMERAALAVADEICGRFLPTENGRRRRVCIVCGGGNNGGDGLALGRMLNERGFYVHFFVSEGGKCSEANALQRRILENLRLTVDTGEPADEYDIMIDALFGTGLSREITGSYRSLIERLNEMNGYKVAVDIPSGICADDGTVLGCAFRADLTVTFAFYKWGQLLYPGRELCGETVCADIGIPETALCENPAFGRMPEESDAYAALLKRKNDSHKGTYGKAGIVAGSKQMGGAVILCAKAAMKTGVGYTKVVTHKSNREPLLAAVPEALLYLYEDGREKPLSALQDCGAIAIGPGLGTGKEAQEMVEEILTCENASLIIDADAVNILAMREDLRKKLKQCARTAAEKGNIVVLTPHKKEFSGLTGISMRETAAAWRHKAADTAREYGVMIVLKDAATCVYTPEGTVYVNTTGNPGMSTAGSGDVLTGILCGLAAQAVKKELAVAAGVYLHGKCGDEAARVKNPYAMTAMDLTEALNDVLKGAAEDEAL